MSYLYTDAKKYAEKYKLFMKQYDDIKIDYMWYFYEIMKKNYSTRL